MDFSVDLNYGLIKDQNHLLNLHKHITRTAKKYNDVRDKTFVYVAKPMDEMLVYNKNLVHVVIQADLHEFDDLAMTLVNYYMCDKLERAVSLFIAEYLVGVPEIKEMTVVAGIQPDDSYIVPCVHIIYQTEDAEDSSCIDDLVMLVSIINNVIISDI